MNGLNGFDGCVKGCVTLTTDFSYLSDCAATTEGCVMFIPDVLDYTDYVGCVKGCVKLTTDLSD